MTMREWDVEFLDRTQALYPAHVRPGPKPADIERGSQTPNIVPIIKFKFGILGRMFDIVKTQY